MNDNQDLQRISGRLLAMITSITPSLELIEPLMDALMSILQSAEVSYPDPYGVKLII
jgi:proteasome activator subunit 4